MKKRALLTKAISGCIIMCAIFLNLSVVHAHPHVFVVQRLDILFDDGGLAGIKVRWEFDDMFANMIAEDHDVDRDGQLEAKEVRSVKEKAFSFTSEYNYFHFIKIDNTPFEVKLIRDFNAILENRKLVYEFLIPCHVTATSHFKKVSVASYDPSYYTSIHFAQEKPVSLTAADDFEVLTAIREDPDTRIYFDMIHPWTLFMAFRKKP